MTNHFRTLLLNAAAAATPVPGDEYVPADFRPVRLPQNLKDARRALFGPGADRAGMNLTAARILAFAHTSRFAADVTAGDRRITYDPRRPADVWWTLGASYTTVSGGDPVGWDGSASFGSAGRGFGRWSVTSDGAGGYTVVVDGGDGESGSVVATAVGDVIPLPGSRLSVVVPASQAGQWDVTLVVPPSHQWASAASASGDGVFDPEASAAEAGWFAAWSDPFEIAPLRATALALAVAARTGELAAGGG